MPLSWYHPAAALSILQLALGVPAVFAEDSAKVQKLCPTVWIEGREEIDLGGMEKRLVCGDQSGDAQSEPWRKIPPSQRKFHLTTFLQSRGYYSPVFSLEGDRTHVALGEQTRVTGITVENEPEGLEFARKRGVIGELLTPKLLSDLEQWVEGRMRAVGFPCPVIRSRADAQTGHVTVTIEPHERQNLVSIEEEPIEGIRPGTLRRYDAFRLGQPFNGDLLRVTENRILEEDLVQAIHFLPSCGPQGAVARQSVTPGAPRILRFGLGTNTEGLFLTRASWKNVRLGKNASLINVTAIASAREQELRTDVFWYFMDHPSRYHLRPLFRVDHQNKQYFEVLSGQLQLAPAVTWDYKRLGATFRTGPILDLIRTLRGEGPQNSRFLSLETELEVKSHYFEYFRTSPRSGFRATLNARFNSERFLSDTSAQRIWLNGESLWNLAEYDPPLLIFGVRGGIWSTLTPDRLGSFTRLPATYRYYLGGSQDLRGFGLDELPDETGSFAAAFTDFETRVNGVLPLGIQPFVFVDLGLTGREPAQLRLPLFWSPGFGLRWESPIGVFRTSLAHGFVSGQPGSSLSHWQFFFSFGEEF